jgi:uncharacterized protein
MSDRPTDPAWRCPICRAPSEAATRPFCSKRCADVDLLRWLRGGYVIEGASDDDDEDGRVGDLGDDGPPMPKRLS